ncbi:butyrate kinase [Zhurongbacter thermophilus]|jgi:butyrate kinase
MGYKILVINPGSTSTKVALFEDEKKLWQETVRHDPAEIQKFDRIADQYEFRKNTILRLLEEKGVSLQEIDAFVGRGGLLKPMEGGTYRVNEKMLDDLRNRPMGEHASNLGALIAYELAQEAGGKPAFIVDPVVVDEMVDIARPTGWPEFQRKSIFHALNQRAIARKWAREQGKDYKDVNVVVAHMGGGISIGAHKQGRVIDVNNALDGEGPMSPERSGTLPVYSLAKLCFEGKYDKKTMLKKIKGQGGWVAHLGTSNAIEIEKDVEAGDEKAQLVVGATAYQVAKWIGHMAAALEGKVDAILLTGGLAYFKWFVDKIKEHAEWIAPIYVYPGEMEMEALALGALRVLKGEEEAKEYV